MRLKMIWQLMKVNILYAGQASALTRYRQKQAANPNKKLDVPMILFRQYLLVGALYVFLFCFMNGFFQLAGAPIRFTVICFRLRAHDARTGLYDLLQCLL